MLLLKYFCLIFIDLLRPKRNQWSWPMREMEDHDVPRPYQRCVCLSLSSLSSNNYNYLFKLEERIDIPRETSLFSAYTQERTTWLLSLAVRKQIQTVRSPLVATQQPPPLGCAHLTTLPHHLLPWPARLPLTLASSCTLGSHHTNLKVVSAEGWTKGREVRGNN